MTPLDNSLGTCECQHLFSVYINQQPGYCVHGSGPKVLLSFICFILLIALSLNNRSCDASIADAVPGARECSELRISTSYRVENNRLKIHSRWQKNQHGDSET